LNKAEIIDITPENIDKYGIGCIRDKKHPGVIAKKEWYLTNYKDGVRIKQLLINGNYGGFIEYVPGRHAWRPVRADRHLFIHCIWVYPKKYMNCGYGSLLIDSVIKEASESEFAGVAVVTSKGSWLAGSEIFTRMGFLKGEEKDRFELLHYPLTEGPVPSFISWEKRLADYQGTHLILSHQCPANARSLADIQDIADENQINLKTEIIDTDAHAREMPSGFGVFQLIHNGRVVQDHYISGTRFKNILKKDIL